MSSSTINEQSTTATHDENYNFPTETDIVADLSADRNAFEQSTSYNVSSYMQRRMESITISDHYGEMSELHSMEDTYGGDGIDLQSPDKIKAIAENILSDIMQEIGSLRSDTNELVEYVEHSLEEVIDSKAATRNPEPHEIFFWTTYFFLQFCGYKFFLATLFYYESASLNSKDELATMITDIVDEVAENAKYLDSESKDPVKMARNLIWCILNKPAFQRRYMGFTEAQITAGDILEDLIEKFDLIPHEESETEFRRQWLRKKRKVPVEEPVSPCADFTGIFTIAEDFIDRVLNAAIFTTDSEPAIISKQQEFRFPSIASFSIEVGESAIISYINTWTYKENWMYVLNYLMAQSDACSDYYFYELVWSLPTKLYPVAQATASVIFKIEVSRVKPEDCPIDLSYKYEGNSLNHTPFTYPFKESWLIIILESKLNLFKQLKF